MNLVPGRVLTAHQVMGGRVLPQGRAMKKIWKGKRRPQAMFRELNDWFEEFRLYHRKDGRVVK